MEGRRIVDISHLFDQIKNTRHLAYGCSFSDMEFQSEHIKGYKSTFTFKCKVCLEKSSITTEKEIEEGYQLIML